MLTCKEATHIVSEAQDRPLGFRESWALRIHLWMCVSCRAFERQIRTLRLALRQLGDWAGDKEMPAEAKERIRKTLSEHHPPHD